MSEELDLSQFDGHTEGPWLLCVETNYWNICTRPHGMGDKYIEVTAEVMRNGRESDEPNSRLIAAAPQLLAEVKKLRRFTKWMGFREHVKWEQFKDLMEDEDEKSTL